MLNSDFFNYDELSCVKDKYLKKQFDIDGKKLFTFNFPLLRKSDLLNISL